MSTPNNYDAMSIKDLRSLLTLRGFDCSQCLEKDELIAAATKLDNTDYDEEARKLFRELNLQPVGARSRYSNLDAIWKDPNTSHQASVYVGNYQAASDRRTLQERGIGAIVNCQDTTSKNYFEDDASIHYYRFTVSRLAIMASRGSRGWKADDLPPITTLEGGFQAAFDFVQSHLDQGTSVLIHCLAGAHRAGTMGTAWLMYKTHKGVDESLVLAKACRPIINPFGTLIGLLHLLEAELKEKEQHPPRVESS